MKKILGLALISALIISCSNKKEKEAATETGTTEVADMHNSRNSLDYGGTYRGTFPCADCDKIDVELTLDNNNFTLVFIYHKNGEATKSEKSGKYIWEENGNNIILEGVTDSPNRFQVGENILIQLDMEGNAITGENAAMYILRKDV